MKKMLSAIMLALAIMLVMPAGVLAAEPEALPEATLTPASHLYFAETWLQRMSLMLAFRAEARVEKALRYAGEKVAEMEAEAERSEYRYMERAAHEYCYWLEVAAGNARNTATSQQIALAMSDHVAIMIARADAGDQRCQQVRSQSRVAAENCQQSAVRTLALRDPEAALRLNLTLMDQQCARIAGCAAGQDREQVQEQLRQYERIRAFNEEIVAAAVQIGNGPQAREMVQAAADNQSGVLAQIRNQMQTSNEGAADSPEQTRTREQEQCALESGSNQPDPTTTPEQMRNRVGQTDQSGPGPDR